MIRNNVPFDVAHDLVESGPEGQAEALAYAVVFASFEGMRYNWTTHQYEERK